MRAAPEYARALLSVHWLGSDNQDIWQNLALTSIGGLVSSTILILLALPTLYYFGVRLGWIARDVGRWLLSVWRRLRGRFGRRDLGTAAT